MYELVIHAGFVGASPRVLKNVKPGRTLLDVLLASRVAIRHDCGGVCHCTTCHVQVIKGAEHIDEKSKRESDFLNRVKGASQASRLSCQCLLLEGRGTLEMWDPLESTCRHASLSIL